MTIFLGILTQTSEKNETQERYIFLKGTDKKAHGTNSKCRQGKMAWPPGPVKADRKVPGTNTTAQVSFKELVSETAPPQPQLLASAPIFKLQGSQES